MLEHYGVGIRIPSIITKIIFELDWSINDLFILLLLDFLLFCYHSWYLRLIFVVFLAEFFLLILGQPVDSICLVNTTVFNFFSFLTLLPTILLFDFFLTLLGSD